MEKKLKVLKGYLRVERGGDGQNPKGEREGGG
jgi:hypothetical protein